jgi:hypothetical protein
VNSAEEFEKIRQIWVGAQLRTEGGNPAVFFPAFRFESGGASATMDLLLYPQSHGSYVTRLFFRQRLSRGPNWNPHFLCGETWWAPSWNNVHPNQSWLSMLANHLKAVA